MVEVLKQLFSELKQVKNISEIGYHKVEDGRIRPVYKISTTDIDLDSWKEYHKNNPVYIESNAILKQVVETKQHIVRNNTLQMDDQPAFKSFNINSIFIVPIVFNHHVIGFVDMPSLNENVIYSDSTVIECLSIINKYSSSIIQAQLYKLN